MLRPHFRRLSTQIFAAQLAILTATVLIGFLLFAHEARTELNRQYEQRAAAIAQTVAGVPDIQRCLAGVGCSEPIQTVASRIQGETGASYVVVIDMQRIRHSHPDPSLIGQQVEEPIVTADGRTHVGINDGSTGPSANGKAPMYAPDGQMIGEVSVGLRESSVSAALWHELPVYGGWFALALAAGAVASWLLARRLKRRTFGLELDEIARLLQEREATLHGIREGVIATDAAGRVSVVNDEARRLLGLSGDPVGRWLTELLPAGRLRDVLTGVGPDAAGIEPDELVLTDDFCLTVNRMPVVLAGRAHGAVATVRDRTELIGLLRELDGVRSLTDSLRAQQHEFSNRMHAVAGLLELGRVEEALSYLTELRGASATFLDEVAARIGSPLIVGLLLGKAAAAGERGVRLEVSADSWVGEAPERAQALVTILGNLIDNAMDAVAGQPGGRVEVGIVEGAETVTIRVADNGPGLADGSAELVFLDGYSTKPAQEPLRRGLGLAIVHRLVHRLGGQISLNAGPGAVFLISLPRVPEARPVVSGLAR